MRHSLLRYFILLVSIAFGTQLFAVQTEDSPEINSILNMIVNEETESIHLTQMVTQKNEMINNFHEEEKLYYNPILEEADSIITPMIFSKQSHGGSTRIYLVAKRLAKLISIHKKEKCGSEQKKHRLLKLLNKIKRDHLNLDSIEMHPHHLSFEKMGITDPIITNTLSKITLKNLDFKAKINNCILSPLGFGVVHGYGSTSFGRKYHLIGVEIILNPIPFSVGIGSGDCKFTQLHNNTVGSVMVMPISGFQRDSRARPSVKGDITLFGPSLFSIGVGIFKLKLLKSHSHLDLNFFKQQLGIIGKYGNPISIPL